ncbi:MAG TPA: hypothetical protein VI455_02080 [Terriglobia bacterium]
MLRAGWGLLWRRQRVLWWVYFISLALAFFATQPLVATIGPILNHSLAADRLYHAFDVATFIELLSRPEVKLQASAMAALLSLEFTPQTAGLAPLLLGVVFLVLMLLFLGGILKVYNEDRSLTTGEFFGAGGGYFWRFFRLLIFLLIALAPVRLINLGFGAWSDSLANRLAPPAPSVVVNLAGKLVVLFLLMAVRLWFDMAEVQTVAEDEYAMRRSIVGAGRLTWRNFGALFWIYLRPSLLAWIGTALAFWAWVRLVPHQAVVASLVLSQAVIFLWILTRFWQRSAEVLWYQQHAASPEVFVEPAPLPRESMEAPPRPEVPPAEVSL